MKPPGRGSQTQRGSILIYTLWVCALLSIFVFSAGYSARQRLLVTGRLEDRVYLRDGAQSSAERALWAIHQPRQETPYDTLKSPWSVNAHLFKEFHSSRVTVSVKKSGPAGENPPKDNLAFAWGLVDEESKLNVNTQKNSQMLRRLFQLACRADDPLSAVLADSVVDWIDADDSVNPSGAETPFYRSDKIPRVPRNAALRRYEELRDIQGMTPEIYASVLPYVTLFGDGKININTARATVLEAAGLPHALVEVILTYRLGNDSVPGTADDGVFSDISTVSTALETVQNLSADDLNTLNSVVTGLLFKVTSDFYFLHATARLDSGRQELELESVLGRESGIVSWRESFRVPQT